MAVVASVDSTSICATTASFSVIVETCSAKSSVLNQLPPIINRILLEVSTIDDSVIRSSTCITQLLLFLSAFCFLSVNIQHSTRP